MSAGTPAGPAAYFDPRRVDELAGPTASLVRRRQAAMGPAYRLFYDEPVQLVRGAGAHLFDAQGTDYLDAYNNVASVGHAHPRVAAAIGEQAAVLSTHTRYLDERIVTYSEQLLDTLPAALGHVMYTCTGSEAGDLALRIAKNYTGGTGIVVTRNAYHGVTTETAAISPSLGGVDTLAPWVRTVEPPHRGHVDPTRPAAVGEWFAAQVAAAIEELAVAGIRFAGFIADSIFASDGIVPDPAGFLRPAVDVVHQAGGLYIADEVQAGFARTGETYWGFDRHSVVRAPLVPDLVTIGKPMGNGMPIAATMMRPEVVESFGRDVRYFNTFGGNAVSIAAAQAVLDVVRDEHLQGHAARVGASLLSMLAELAVQHPVITQVRGAGLFIGVELSHPGAGSSADFTVQVSNELRQRHVLTGTTGLHNNVLKIRPPLVFSESDAERLTSALDATLTHLAPTTPTPSGQNDAFNP
jgi:4-aminobutyrate aminotransferase-like enzyme